jgi:hypothetical protein
MAVAVRSSRQVSLVGFWTSYPGPASPLSIKDRCASTSLALGAWQSTGLLLLWTKCSTNPKAVKAVHLGWTVRLTSTASTASTADQSNPACSIACGIFSYKGWNGGPLR